MARKYSKKSAIENKDPAAPVIRRAKWNSSCDGLLVECLEKEKVNGRMTSNSSWHSDAWTAAEKALSGSELHSGGGPKTADSCQNRWTTVSYFICLLLFFTDSPVYQLKKEYVQVKSLREKSGFGWDDVKKLVTATEEVWQALFMVNFPNMHWDCC